MSEIRPGLEREQTFTVTHATTAAAIFEGTPTEVRGMPAVWSTPDMIAKMEVVAAALVAPLLPVGQITVGSRNEVSHLGATPEGRTVRVQATLRAVEGRKLTFTVEAYDEKEKVGEGTHVRHVVDQAKFMSRLNEKW
jgi:fluoroacetyl-CoA thioesterase